MSLSALPKTAKREKKRVGRGYGSGKGGHTAGRGTKGRKSRGKVPIEFDGTARGGGFYKRLPYLRGKGKLKPNAKKPIGVNVEYLNVFDKNETVDVDLLIKHNIVEKSAATHGVKILGNGDLTVPLTVLLSASKGAREKIEKAGGTIGEKSEKRVSKKEAKSFPISSKNKSK